MARGVRLARRLAGYGGSASLKGPSFKALRRATSMGGRVTRTSTKLPIIGAEAGNVSALRRGGGMMSRIGAAKKGKYIAGGIVAAGGLGAAMNRRSSGLDPVRGRPTGPYVF